MLELGQHFDGTDFCGEIAELAKRKFKTAGRVSAACEPVSRDEATLCRCGALYKHAEVARSTAAVCFLRSKRRMPQ